MLVGRTVASVIGACHIAVVVVDCVRGRRVLGREVLVGVLDGVAVTKEYVAIEN